MESKLTRMLLLVVAATATLVMAGCPGTGNDNDAPSYGIALYAQGGFPHAFETLEQGFTPGELTPLTVRVDNTGNRPTGWLAVELSGDYAAFNLPSNEVPSIAPGGNDTFTVLPTIGLPVGVYTATVTVSGAPGSGIAEQSFEVSFEVEASPDFGIRLDATGLRTFPRRLPDYTQDDLTPLVVTVRNVGIQATGELVVALSGVNVAAFELSRESIGSMATGGSGEFTVAPVVGLGIGTYTATVTVWGTHVEPRAFDIVFEVSDDIEITDSFTCPNFLAVVRHILTRPTGPIMFSDVKDWEVLNFPSSNITSLAGIEHFVSLEGLMAGENNLSYVDLSRNTQLTTIWLRGNNLTTIDLSGLGRLGYVNLSHNQLHTVTFGYNPRMSLLDLSGNAFTSLYLYELPNLTSLQVFMNYNLTYLNVSRNTELTFIVVSHTALTSLDLSNNTSLADFIANSTHHLTEVIWPQESPYLRSVNAAGGALTRFVLNNAPLLEEVHLDNQPFLAHLDLSNNPVLWRVASSFAQFTSTQDIRLHGTIVTDLAIMGANLASFDASDFPDTIRYLDLIMNENLATIDVTTLANLHFLNVALSSLTTLDVSQNHNLRRLAAVSSRLTGRLDVSNNPYLWQLWVQGNYLTEVDITGSGLGGPPTDVAMWMGAPLIVAGNYMTSPDNVIGWREQEYTLFYGLNFEFWPQRGFPIIPPEFVTEKSVLNAYVGEPFHFEFATNPTYSHMEWSFIWGYPRALNLALYYHSGVLVGTPLPEDEGTWTLPVRVETIPSVEVDDLGFRIYHYYSYQRTFTLIVHPAPSNGAQD